MWEQAKSLAANKLVVIGIAVALAIGLLVMTRKKPLSVVTPQANELHGAAVAETNHSKEHEEQVAKYEAAAKVHEARESQLSSNIARLKRELEEARKRPGSVGGTELHSGGGSGDAAMDDSVVSKLDEVVAEQGALIVELKTDLSLTKAALFESKLATSNLKLAMDKESQSRALLQATVDRVTAEAKREIAKAEWRGGYKGAAVGVLIRSLIPR